MYQIRKYQTAGGLIPFDEWMKGLHDAQVRARILTREDITCARRYWIDYQQAGEEGRKK